MSSVSGLPLCVIAMESVSDYIDEKYTKSESFSRIYFFKQVFICSGIWIIFFMNGLFLGAPTVFIPQLRKESNSTVISDEMASWLSSTFAYGAAPCVALISLISIYFGRKLIFFLIYVHSFAGFVLLYFSKTTTHLLISEVLLSVVQAHILTISPIMITEYTSPKYRGVFLTIKSASIFWGIWVSNAIGTYTHWKYIGMLGVVCSCYCISIFFWPESPYWLVTKNRFDECAAAQRWLKGAGEESHTELLSLIESQKQIEISNKKRKFEVKKYFCKEFYMPLLLTIITVCLYHSSGKLVCTVYAIEIVKKITKNEPVAYQAMLILDGITVFGMYVGCGLSKIIKRKVLLLASSSIGVMFLFMLSLYLYLIKLSLIRENNIVSILILTMFSITISCGPMILSSSIYGELIPQRFKTMSMILYGSFTTLSMATILKIAPLIFKTITLPGAFLLYGLSCSFFILLLYKYLPETKDKTLQEIEMFFKDD